MSLHIMIQEQFSPGHFYSVIPNVSKTYHKRNPTFLGLDFNEQSHLTILEELPSYLQDFDAMFGDHRHSSAPLTSPLFDLRNDSFGWMDARLLHYFLQKNKPKKIIEVGSGNSTILTYNTKMMYQLDFEIICIEPYPNDHIINLHNEGKIRLIQDKLENVHMDLFTSLEMNDILFIDSSHVVKLDSDVLFYFTNIFPLLQKGVCIHIHDIFFPYDYPLEWIHEGRFWNEQYFLYVFLQYNTTFKIVFCNSYSGFQYSEKLKEIQKTSYEITHQLCKGDYFTGGSIWITVAD
jgi:hypothetical protein